MFGSYVDRLTGPSTGIKRTKLRLVRCRARMGMTDRERVRDARRDDNLTDVPRIPAPWDVAPTEGGTPPPETDIQNPQ